jgi:hypothetical protein
MAVLLVAGALGAYALVERPQATSAGATDVQKVPHHPVPAPKADALGAESRPSSVGTLPATPEAPPPAPSAPSESIPAPPRHLAAEAGLLAELDGQQGLDVQAVTALIKGDRFSDFMDELAHEAATSPLALDITDLYTQSAAESNAAAGDELTVRVVCGMTVCGVSATAPSKDAFDVWFQAFIGNPAAPPYGAGRHDKISASGVTEYRVVFSTDQERQHVIMPRR